MLAVTNAAVFRTFRGPGVAARLCAVAPCGRTAEGVIRVLPYKQATLKRQKKKEALNFHAKGQGRLNDGA
jgi:hypothetical protein